MPRADYYEDRRFCPTCSEYVLYISSIDRAYCIECGGRVRLFSAPDMARFRSALDARSRSWRLVPGSDEEAAPEETSLEGGPSEQSRIG